MKPGDAKSIRKALGRALRRADAGPGSLSQADFGQLLDLSSGNARKTIERWETNGPTGPGGVALTYLGQGLLDDAMRQVMPEFVFGGPAGGGGRHDADYVIRLWWPRFVGMAVPADAPVEGDWAWIAEDVEKLAVFLWIDDPAPADDRMAYIRRATALIEIATQDAGEEIMQLSPAREAVE